MFIFNLCIQISSEIKVDYNCSKLELLCPKFRSQQKLQTVLRSHVLEVILKAKNYQATEFTQSTREWLMEWIDEHLMESSAEQTWIKENVDLDILS